MATDPFFDISGRVILITGAASGLGLSKSEMRATFKAWHCFSRRPRRIF